MPSASWTRLRSPLTTILDPRGVETRREKHKPVKIDAEKAAQFDPRLVSIFEESESRLSRNGFYIEILDFG